VNSTHVVIATQSAHLLMLNNSGDIEWKQKQLNLTSGL